MEQLLLEQEEAVRTVARALSNLKKLGQNNFTIAKLQGRLDSLKSNYQLCVQLHNRLRCYEGTADAKKTTYFTKNVFLSCEEHYETTRDFIYEHLYTLQHASSTTAPPGLSSDATGTSEQPPAFRLPQINLPTFSGDLHEWESFRDKFTALILNERSLSDVMRLHYLGSCLKGEPSNLIKHLPITAANFQPAWKLIVSRYENKRCLISAHLQTLYSLPQASNESVRELNHLRDKTNFAIQALRTLGLPVDSWDAMLVFLVSNKLDKASRQAWELKVGGSTEYPKYNELEEFIEARARALDVIQTASHTNKPRAVQSHAATETSVICPLCRAAHYLTACPVFRAKSEAERFEFIKENKRCINCLSSAHTVTKCTNKFTCKKCKHRHHTMLHFHEVSSNQNKSGSMASTASTVAIGQNEFVTSHLISRSISPKSKILLATAWVNVSSVHGRQLKVRALLDQGSVTTLISENLAQRLRLHKRRVSVSISGIGETESSAKHEATIRVAPVDRDEPSLTTNALILKRLTRYVPGRRAQPVSWAHIHDLQLADNDPMSSHPIEILIGADLYGFILLDGIRTGSANEPIAQNSIFGWILSGPANSRVAGQASNISALHCTSLDRLERDIRSFWETEELPLRAHLTPDEQQCEDHFIATHSRDSTGRYVVRLPFKESIPIDIGESRRVALTMLSRHESRLSRNPDLRNEYDQFLGEYARLGHMRTVSYPAPALSQCVYIPHHAVVRDHSATTRLRVVFNASSHTSNGTSLNDHLLIGPKLQTDLSSVILRWRQYKYVLTADIAKMYRQIRIDPRDVDYQRILWRPPFSKSVEDYQLLTVTYGTAPAPYLALRVLQQLVKDEGSRFPLAIPVLRNHIYVDDCVFGADDVMSARKTRDQLIALLNTAQFHLRKWASNSAALLSDLSSDDHGLACDKTLQTDDSLKVLGVTWNPDKDSFQFRVALSSPRACTKRSILSNIARLFDPLGWVTPVTVTAKILMQKIWLLKCEWDELLPGDIQGQWQEYYMQLPHLQQLQIPRWLELHPSNQNYELHGFADASSVAYAAVVYLLVTTNDGRRIISLLAAKSKVAPVKPLTIPRLELSAALLLSRLITFVTGNLKRENLRCYCWTDSTVTLHWLSQPPAHWKPFVANRVADIQNNIPNAHWRYVPTEDNPADCASRGLLPSQLLAHELWWKGPEWLRLADDHWPENLVHIPSDPPLEKRATVSVHVTTEKDEGWT